MVSLFVMDGILNDLTEVVNHMVHALMLDSDGFDFQKWSADWNASPDALNEEALP